MSLSSKGIWSHSGSPNANFLENTSVNPKSFTISSWNIMPYTYNISSLGIVANDKLTLSGYLQVDANSATHCALAIEWFNTDSDRVQYPSVYIEPGNDGYCQVTQALPAAYASGKIRIRIQTGASTGATGTYWKLKLEKNDVATSWVPKSTDNIYINGNHSFIEYDDKARIQKNDYIEANSFIEL